MGEQDPLHSPRYQEPGGSLVGGLRSSIGDFDHAHMAAVLRHWQRRWERIKELQTRMSPDERAAVEKTGWSDFAGDHDEIVQGLARSTHPELVDVVIDLLDADADHHLTMAVVRWEQVKEGPPTMDPHERPPETRNPGTIETSDTQLRIDHLEEEVAELRDWAADVRAALLVAAKGFEIPPVPRRKK